MGMKNIQMGRAPDCTHVAHLENILGVEALKVFFFISLNQEILFYKKKTQICEDPQILILCCMVFSCTTTLSNNNSILITIWIPTITSTLYLKKKIQ